MKSKLPSKILSLKGIGDVVSPRAVTYNGTCHQWFIYGLSSSLTFPTTCVHICSVSHVSFHASNGNAGHSSGTFSSAILFLMSMFLSVGLSIVLPFLLILLHYLFCGPRRIPRLCISSA